MHSATDIPLVEPTEVTAGDTVKWRREDLSEHYPASLWTLKYYGYGLKGQLQVDGGPITASADGDDFEVNVAAAASAAWQPGDYTLEGYVTEIATNERYRVFKSTVKVLVNPAELGSDFHDDRSFAKTCLDSIEGEMERRAGRSDRSYSIAGRNLEYMTMKELQDARARFKQEYEAEVAAVNIANGKASGRRILTQFVSPR